MPPRNAQPLRVFHGPVNIAGAGGYMAEEQRRRGLVAHFMVFEDLTTPIVRKNHDICLHLNTIRDRYRIFVRLKFLLYCLSRYDVFHFYFAQTLLPFGLDLPLLRLFGKKIVMQYCGSDVRLFELENQRNPYQVLTRSGLGDPRFDAMKRRRLRWQSLWAHRALATRNLVLSVSVYYPADRLVSDIWVPTSLCFAQEEKPARNIHPRSKPVLVHAPSNPEIKGTAYVEKALETLRKAGYEFEFRCIQSVPHQEAQRIYREEADIILDQFLLGGVGSLAMEGMYAGKPVVAYHLDEVKDAYCPDIPIVNATIDTLKDRIAELLDHPESWEEIGRDGRAFVEKYCDRAQITDRLIELYRNL